MVLCSRRPLLDWSCALAGCAEYLAVLVYLLRLFYVPGTGVGVRVDYCRIIGIGKLQDCERSGHCRMRAYIPRQYSDLDMVKCRKCVKVLHLRCHDLRSAHLSREDCLIQNGSDLRRVCAAENCPLPFRSPRDASVDSLLARIGPFCAIDGTDVVGSLE